MEVKYLVQEKNVVEFEIPNLTVAEILRVYLNNDSEVTFVAWKRDHYTTTPVLKVKTKSKDAKAVIKAAIKSIVSDLDVADKDFKALK